MRVMDIIKKKKRKKKEKRPETERDFVAYASVAELYPENHY